MRYMAVIEKGVSSCGAFVSDLPECIDVGKTQEAIQFHIEGLKLEGQLIRATVSASTFVDIPF